jgi:protein dithiol oxidoreductase (disulfide-forming)
MSRFFAWLLLLALPLTACAQAPAVPLQAGVDYELLQGGQRWQQAPDGKIEVVEVFAYWCPHCADFQPMVDAWKQRKPADVNFVYVPAAYDPEDAYARAYFAAELARAVPKTHQALFDAVHEEGALPRSNVSIDELGTWFGQRGLNRAKMVASMRSKDVDARMARARDFMVANRIGSTPTLIVNGKYVVRARRLEDRMRVVDGLIAMERAAAKKR